MAANYWTSSHGLNWIYSEAAVHQARAEDLKYATKQELGLILVWSANAIHKISKKLSLRQQVAATAVVFFRRFYMKNSYAETDPCLVAAACLYVAGKAEEMPVHIKSVVAESRTVFTDQGASYFSADNHKLAEMEFYLLEDLEFHLIVHHPYKALAQICGKDNAKRDGTLDIKSDTLDMAWYILNDTYRTELCLLYPPHLIAIAALFIAFSHTPPPPPGTIVNKPIATLSKPPSRPVTPESRPSTPQPSLHPSLPQKPMTIMQPVLSRSVSHSTPSSLPAAPTTQATQAIGKVDPLTFLSRLNVSLPLVLQIVQQIIPLYTLWNAYETEGRPTIQGGTPGRSPMPGGGVSADEKVVKLLARIRMERMSDLAHPASGRPSAVPGHVRK